MSNGELIIENMDLSHIHLAVQLDVSAEVGRWAHTIY